MLMTHSPPVSEINAELQSTYRWHLRPLRTVNIGDVVILRNRIHCTVLDITKGLGDSTVLVLRTVERRVIFHLTYLETGMATAIYRSQDLVDFQPQATRTNQNDRTTSTKIYR